MKKLALAVALASTLGASSALAVEDSEWGAWASTDSDALARILAADHDDRSRSQPEIGADDSNLMNAGFLLTAFLQGIIDGANGDLGDTIQDLLNDPTNLGAVNDAIGNLTGDIPTDPGAIGGVVSGVVNEVCTGLALTC